jgi:hypothetical protein
MIILIDGRKVTVSLRQVTPEGNQIITIGYDSSRLLRQPITAKLRPEAAAALTLAAE